MALLSLANSVPAFLSYHIFFGSCGIMCLVDRGSPLLSRRFYEPDNRSISQTSAYLPGAARVQPLAGLRPGPGHRPRGAPNPRGQSAALPGTAASRPLSVHRRRPGLPGRSFFRHGHDERTDSPGASPRSPSGRSIGRRMGVPAHKQPRVAPPEGDTARPGVQ